GRTLIVAILGAQTTPWPDAAALLDWGFAQAATTASVGTLVGRRAAEPTPTPTAVVSAATDPTPRGETTSQAALRAWEPQSWEYVAVGTMVLLGAAAATVGVRSRRRRQRRLSRMRTAALRAGRR
ncbi:MAG TPA: hypothetical protein VFR46_05740, partial [Actinomycetes bacterium]|nr:hypothetical protein [Actinomycetes bacterium]